MNELIKYLYKPLFHRALKLYYHVQDAEDITQDVMEKIVKVYDRYFVGKENDESLKICYGMMYNLFIDKTRYKKRRIKITPVDDLPFDFNEAYSLKEKPEFDLQEAWSFIDKTEFTFKDSLILFLYGYKCREIADAKRCSVNTITGDIRRARKQLNKFKSHF